MSNDDFCKQFFFKRPCSNHEALTDIETGDFDFDALAAGDPKHYIGTEPTFEDLPGKVVLCAALLQQESPEFIEELKETLFSLVQKGISIHFFNPERQGISSALTSEQIRTLEQVVPPVDLNTYKTVLPLLAQQALSADEVTVLDDIRLKNLVLRKKDYTPGTFILADLIHNQYHFDPDALWQAFIQNPAHVLGLTLMPHGNEVEYGDQLVTDTVSFIEHYIPRPQFLEFLILNLQNLSSRLIPLNELIARKQMDWRDLKVLNLLHSDINTQNLNILLRAAPNLKKLKIVGCKNITELAVLANSLLLLEELDVPSINISAENLIVLLRAAPNLKKLKIVGCKNITDLAVLANNLLLLEELDVNSTNISAENLIVLLRAAPNLKKLNIAACKNITDLAVLANSLLLLEELDVLYSNINAQDLITLLRAAPNLKKLNISACKNITDLAVLANSLLLLEELNVSFTNISAQDLIILLRAAPNLKKLKISACNNITGLIIPENSLLLLEELDVSYTNISAQDLITLLRAASNLKKLNISACNNITGLIIPENSLLLLEELDVSRTNISAEDLITLLRAAPNLKKLNIAVCTNITGLVIPENSLLLLEELDVSDTNINAQDLIILLRAAPNLKKLKINGCDNIFNESNFYAFSKPLFDVLPPEDYSHLEEVEVHISDNTCEIAFDYFVRQVLKKAPALRLLKVNLPPEVYSCANIFPDKVTIRFMGDTAPLASPVSPPTTAVKTSLFPALPSSTTTNPGTSGVANFNEETEIDSDTRSDNTTFTPQRIFYAKDPSEHPHLANYRLAVYDGLETEPTLHWTKQEHFQPLDGSTHPQKPNACSSAKALHRKWKTNTQFYAKRQLHLKANEWTTVPSLSANESLPFYYADNNTFEWGYDAGRNLYAIRAKKTCDITLQYIVDVPDGHAPKVPANPVVKAEAERYKTEFVPGDLDVPSDLSGKALLEAFQTHMKGRCRHSVPAFFDWLQQYNKTHNKNIRARCFKNEIHTAVEIFEAGHWKKLVLNNIPDASPEEIQIQEQSIAPSAVRSSPPSLFNAPWLTTAAPLEKSMLIDVPQTDVPRTLALLQTQFNPEVYAFHTIQHPDELRCLISSFVLENAHAKTFTQQHLPSGPLYHFLKSPAPKKIIFVNYNHFKASDLVKYNALLDTPNPTADGIPLPDNVHIIGFYDTKTPRAYTGTDLHSRVEQHYVATTDDLNEYAARDLLEHITVVPHNTTPQKEPGCFEIDLFDSMQWGSFLWGARRLKGKTLHFVPTPLFKALRDDPQSVKKLVLKNAPWHLEKFQETFRKILLSGKIQVGGVELPLPPHLQITQTRGYDWKRLSKNLTFLPFPSETPQTINYLLNPSTLPSFFGLYKQTKTQEKKYTQGWLKRNKGKALNLHLTRELSSSEWARLLTQAQKYKISLTITKSPHLQVPDTLNASLPRTSTGHAVFDIHQHFPLAGTGAVIVSNDIAYTTAYLQQQLQHHIDQIITLSDAQERYLFHLNGSQKFQFTHEFSDLWKALVEGKTVLLKGKISPRVQDTLAGLLQQPGFLYYNGKPQHFTGRLLVLTDESALKNATPALYKHTSTVEERLTLLAPQKVPFAEKSPSYEALKACAQSHLHPTPSSQAHDRVQALSDAFGMTRSLCVRGAPGTGKTHCIESLKQQSGFTVSHDIETWAKNQTASDTKVLVIDNINCDYLAHQQYHLLQDACDPQNPSVFIHGHYYPLTQRHKILFLSDVLQKKDYPEHPLFAHQLTFDALSHDDIHHNIIEPLLSSVKRAIDIQGVSALFLKVYQLQSPSMTPRHVEMMALLFASLRAQTTLSDDQLAEYCAYEISQCTRSSREKIETWRSQKNPVFQSQYSALNRALFSRPLNFAHHREFTWLDNHEDTFRTIAQSLKIRDFQQLHAVSSTGTPLIVLEGASGIGKSTFVRHLLQHFGFSEYTEEGPLENAPHPDRTYCFIPAGADEAVQIARLTQAFLHGWVVMMDESNSTPLPVAFLRALLDGHLPSGEKPQRPGFRMIMTQNSIALQGRLPLAPELAQRALLCAPQPYTKHNLLDILQHTLDIPLTEASALLDTTLAMYPDNPDVTTLNARTLLRDAKKIYDDEIMTSSSNEEEFANPQNPLKNSENMDTKIEKPRRKFAWCCCS